MKITPKKIKNLSVKVTRKIKGKTYKDFYHGKSLPTTVYNGFRYTIKKGPRATYRLVKRELFKESRLHFPNGLVSGTDIAKIEHWYKSHGKPVSIVIPSYNDFELIKDCLQSIQQTTKPSKVDVFVVDDYCTKESGENLTSLSQKNIHIILRKKNGGFAKAVNTGFKAAIKKFPNRDVVLLNSDTVAHEQWLASLQYGAYEYHKDVGIVGPKLLYPDGRIQSGGSFRNTDSPEWFDHYYRFQASDYGPANVPQYCIGVTGACMYIKSKTIKQIGILDEKFPFAFEDMDYCVRAWDKGIRSLYYPAATLTHVESATRPKNKTLGPKEKASVEYFWKKWGDWFDNRNVKNKEGKIRIIYVLQLTGVSGGHRIVFEHLNRLMDRGFDVELWSLDKHPTWMELKAPSRSFKNYTQLIKNLENEEAIKVASWWETALPVWLSSVKRGIPAIVMHEIESSFYPDNIEVQRSVISCYRKEFNYFTSNDYNLEEIRSLGLDAELIPCGYDNEIFKQLSDMDRQDNSIVALGRSFFQKNFKQTYEAWLSMGGEAPNLVLFGGEPHIVKPHDKVTYINRPSDTRVNELYNTATVFVQTSYHEGFCLPIIEAMAAGCPVICTDAHGNRGFSIPNKNCLMVEKDDVEGLSNAIKKLMSDKKLQKKLSTEGLKTVEDYTWPVISDKLSKYYEIVASQPKRTYIHKLIGGADR